MEGEGQGGEREGERSIHYRTVGFRASPCCFRSPHKVTGTTKSSSRERKKEGRRRGEGEGERGERGRR